MADTPRLPGLKPAAGVAVVEVAGEPVVLRRADGGMPMTSRIAVAKARTTVLAPRPSGGIDLPAR